jgi:hypothetical protein
MPPSMPGALGDQANSDLVSYLLQANGLTRSIVIQ